jgi:hypothetical protein
MSAPTTLLELSNVGHASLTPESLKAIRIVLILKSSSAALNLDLPDDAATVLFTALLRTANDPTIPHPHRSVAVETLSAWLIRARTHASLRAPFPEAFETLADVFLAHFDDAPTGLSKLLKDLLANTITLAAQLEIAEDLVRKLSTRGLVGVSVGEGKKCGYHALDLAVRKGAGAEWVFAYAGGAGKLIREMLTNLVDRDLAPAIGKAVISLLVVRRKELLDRERKEKEWLEIWEGPMRDALRNEELRQRVVTYVLPGLLRPSPESFRLFVEGLGLTADGKADNIGDIDLGALLCILKVGKELGFVGELGMLCCLLTGREGER